MKETVIGEILLGISGKEKPVTRHRKYENNRHKVAEILPPPTSVFFKSLKEDLNENEVNRDKEKR